MRDVAFPLTASEAQTVRLIANPYDLLKEIIQVLASLRANLEVHQPQLFSLASSFSIAHLSLIGEVDLIADQNGEPISSFVIIVEVQPSLSIIEGCFAADIEDNERAVRIP